MKTDVDPIVSAASIIAMLLIAAEIVNWWLDAIDLKFNMWLIPLSFPVGQWVYASLRLWWSKQSPKQVNRIRVNTFAAMIVVSAFGCWLVYMRMDRHWDDYLEQLQTNLPWIWISGGIVAYQVLRWTVFKALPDRPST